MDLNSIAMLKKGRSNNLSALRIFLQYICNPQLVQQMLGNLRGKRMLGGFCKNDFSPPPMGFSCPCHEFKMTLT
ncbi:MAG: hypothetical protein ACI87E_001378 [Mariniblastus sp.]|jgi:hypothetical protein